MDLVDNREKFRNKMKQKGIETGIHYLPIHKFSFYKNSIKLDNTDYVSKRIVTIPTHPNLSDSDVDYIINMINKEKNETYI